MSAAIIACVSCKETKKKCEGGVPCTRCVAAGKGDSCVLAMQKRAGRKPGSKKRALEAEGATGTKTAIARTTMSAEGLLSMLLSHGHMAIAARASALAEALNVDVGRNFLLVRANGNPGPQELFDTLVVVSSEWDGSLDPFFAASVENGLVTWANGRFLKEIMRRGCIAARRTAEMQALFRSTQSSPHAITWSPPFANTLYDARGVPFDAKTKLALVFDERDVIRYMYIIVERAWQPEDEGFPTFASLSLDPVSWEFGDGLDLSSGGNLW